MPDNEVGDQTGANADGGEKTSDAGRTLVDVVAASKALQEAIAQIPIIWERIQKSRLDAETARLEVQTRLAGGQTWKVLAWVFLLAALIVIPVTVLIWNGKMSADAGAFLFGALIGAAFTFMRTFLKG